MHQNKGSRILPNAIGHAHGHARGHENYQLQVNVYMSKAKYQQLLNPPVVHCPSHIAETQNAYHVFTERHLQAMWLEQKYFRSLQPAKEFPSRFSLQAFGIANQALIS